MKQKSPFFFDSLSLFLLVLLWVYTACAKLFDQAEFTRAMLNQEVPAWTKPLLIHGLPWVELLAALLLVIPRTRLTGLYLSFLLLLFFTGYVGLVVAGFYSRTPCSCGGVLKAMGWTTHLFFNLFFLLLTMIAIYRERRARQTGN